MHSHQSLALLTDLYQVTMAYAYWKREMIEDEAVFHLFFRRPPFEGSYALTAGLESVIAYLEKWRFEESDLSYLASIKGDNQKPLFESAFLDYLATLRFSCDLDAVCEGEVLFPFEPLLRICGPVIQCQLLETPFLTLLNFPTLIATKASRIVRAAGEAPVMEFGLRRAQGMDGAMTASRSAAIGGVESTSNLLAGKEFGLQVQGTHAHSWVMAFDSEREAFSAYADVMPGNCVFLVDTYDTLQGVQNAISVGQKMKEQGHTFFGIRLDSGDLAYLSVEARKALDAAGFPDVKIVASNELNEHVITDLRSQGAQIDIWGVGTHLVTGETQAALDGVYKLSAYKKRGEEWQDKLKLSERMTKVSNPGFLQVRRFMKDGFARADALVDVRDSETKVVSIVHPLDSTHTRELDSSYESRELLVPIFRKGKRVYESPSLFEIQDVARSQLSKFHRAVLRFLNPHTYPVGMEKRLYERKMALVSKVRQEGIH